MRGFVCVWGGGQWCSKEHNDTVCRLSAGVYRALRRKKHCSHRFQPNPAARTPFLLVWAPTQEPALT